MAADDASGRGTRRAVAPRRRRADSIPAWRIPPGSGTTSSAARTIRRRRAAADGVLEVMPSMAMVARAGRAFLASAVHYLATNPGISEFLDIGTACRQRTTRTRWPSGPTRGRGSCTWTTTRSSSPTPARCDERARRPDRLHRCRRPEYRPDPGRSGPDAGFQPARRGDAAGRAPFRARRRRSVHDHLTADGSPALRQLPGLVPCVQRHRDRGGRGRGPALQRAVCRPGHAPVPGPGGPVLRRPAGRGARRGAAGALASRPAPGVRLTGSAHLLRGGPQAPEQAAFPAPAPAVRLATFPAKRSRKPGQIIRHNARHAGNVGQGGGNAGTQARSGPPGITAPPRPAGPGPRCGGPGTGSTRSGSACWRRT